MDSAVAAVMARGWLMHPMARCERQRHQLALVAEFGHEDDGRADEEGVHREQGKAQFTVSGQNLDEEQSPPYYLNDPERKGGDAMKYGAVVVMRLLPPWLALDRETRNQKAEALYTVAGHYCDDVDVTWFDADALGSGHTDWVLCRFDSLDRYHAMWEDLRDLEFFFHPYAEIVDVLLGLQNGYQRFEAGEL
ncbi:MAG: darcynin family protein [Acidimicrobiales bacterium]